MLLFAPDTSDADRFAAAQALLARGADHAAAIENALTTDISRPAILQAIALQPGQPLWLGNLIVPLFDAIPAAGRMPVYDAASAVIDRRLAYLLLRDAQIDSTTSQHAYIRLCALVGLDPATTDLATVAAWMEETRTQPEVRWLTDVAQQHAQLSHTRAQHTDAAVEELTASYRMSYDLLKDAPERRPELLVKLIDHDRDELRKLGFTLAERELQAARQPGEAFHQRVVSLLSHPLVDTRTRAASILPRLGFDDGGSAIAAALDQETDPAVASAMLEAVAQRWDTPTMGPLVARWVRTTTPAQPAAFDAARALLDAGMMTDPAHRDAVITAVRTLDVSELGPVHAAIIVSIGDDTDIDRLKLRVARLTEQITETQTNRADTQRTLAALAPIVSNHSAFADVLVSASNSQPELSPFAADALSRAILPADAARAIAALPFVTSRAMLTSLTPLISSLTDAELIALGSLVDTETSIPLYTTLLGRDSVAATDPASDAGIRVRVALGDALLTQANPQAALDTIDTIILPTDPANPAMSEQRDSLVSIRARANLALGRIDEVVRMDVPATIWLAGLREAYWIRSSDVTDIVIAIRERFRIAQLTSAQWAEVEFYSFMAVQSINDAEPNTNSEIALQPPSVEATTPTPPPSGGG